MNSLNFSGNRLATGSSDGSVKIWEADQLRPQIGESLKSTSWDPMGSGKVIQRTRTEMGEDVIKSLILTEYIF